MIKVVTKNQMDKYLDEIVDLRIKLNDIHVDSLKDVFKDKLVIMVSHDEELSKAFSDSIIKLEKGHIVSSVNVVSSTNITNDENNEKFKNVISNKVTFKMALHEFG